MKGKFLTSQFLEWKEIPVRIKIICIFCFISPFVNFIHLLIPYGIKRLNIDILLKILFPLNFFFLILPVLIGAGLYRGTMWSYFLWIVYGLGLLSYNSYITYTNFSFTNLAIVMQSVLILFSLIFILDQDLRSPYFTSSKYRGWRRKKRYEFSKICVINDNYRFRSLNLSESGILLETKEKIVGISLGNTVRLRLENHQEKESIMGKIQRVLRNSIFVSIDQKDGKKLIVEFFGK